MYMFIVTSSTVVRSGNIPITKYSHLIKCQISNYRLRPLQPYYSSSSSLKLSLSSLLKLSINTMHMIEEIFGKNCNLYTDVLECTKNADNATLRKSYYRTALKYHPDKNPNQPSEAAKKFHAITATYQILCNIELRNEYDTTGMIPNSMDENDENDDFDNKENPWKEYFDRIFGKVSVSDIEAFAMKYKCSDEERRDVLKEYINQKGNLHKMIDYVMLSEPRDAQRWVEDYIQPAIDTNDIPSSYSTTMNKTLQQLQKKAEKQFVEEQGKDDIDDDDEDDDFVDDEDMDENEVQSVGDDDDDDATDVDDQLPPPLKRPVGKGPTKSVTPTKAKQTKAKTKRTDATKKSITTTKIKKNNNNTKNDMSNLIAQIQNKNQGGGTSTWANFGARYGVSINDDDDDDPLKDDAKFSKIQSKLKSKSKKKK